MFYSYLSSSSSSSSSGSCTPYFHITLIVLLFLCLFLLLLLLLFLRLLLSKFLFLFLLILVLPVTQNQPKQKQKKEGTRWKKEKPDSPPGRMRSQTPSSSQKPRGLQESEPSKGRKCYFIFRMYDWTPLACAFCGAIFKLFPFSSHYVFTGFVRLQGKWGSDKHPATYIYI